MVTHVLPRFSEELLRRDGTMKVRREGFCRMCLRPENVRPLEEHHLVMTRHHLVPVRWFRRQTHDARWMQMRNASANIVPLCRGCHDLVEAGDASVRVPARVALRQRLTGIEQAFCIQVRGKEWLDQQYPMRVPREKAADPSD